MNRYHIARMFGGENLGELLAWWFTKFYHPNLTIFRDINKANKQKFAKLLLVSSF